MSRYTVTIDADTVTRGLHIASFNHWNAAKTAFQMACDLMNLPVPEDVPKLKARQLTNQLGEGANVALRRWF